MVACTNFIKLNLKVYNNQYFHLKGISLINIKAELNSIRGGGGAAFSFTTIKY